MNGLEGRLVALERLGGNAAELRQDARRVLEILATSPTGDAPLPALDAVAAALRSNGSVSHGEYLVVRSPAGLVIRQYVDVETSEV